LDRKRLAPTGAVYRYVLLGMSRRPTTFDDADARWMSRALDLAETGLGRVWPNPSVGCVLVFREQVVGEGRTLDGGRPHAEAVALAAAGARARGATAYVTLEPCSHWGKTPPCCDALIGAGVARVVIACLDRDRRVDGKGLERIRAAGIATGVGLGRRRALSINRGFFHRIDTGRPWVGRAGPAGDLAARAPSWDAVLVEAVGGVVPVEQQVTLTLAPSPQLTVPSRSGDRTVYPLGRAHAEPEKLQAALALLGETGFTRLLVPAHGRLTDAMLEAGLIDEPDLESELSPVSESS
ncbi:MAG: bifunctional diaminohydroxyphosphoribosylaminopyrimidine deaminase/5-amino-6-(5-phosphoribosylamino)uracil reductase RibD, partial [Myxococcota bacterium]